MYFWIRQGIMKDTRYSERNKRISILQRNSILQWELNITVGTQYYSGNSILKRLLNIIKDSQGDVSKPGFDASP